jgi:hypothetical protein
MHGDFRLYQWCLMHRRYGFSGHPREEEIRGGEEALGDEAFRSRPWEAQGPPPAHNGVADQ